MNMENKDFEVRQVAELHMDEEKRLVQGTAIVFESESKDLGNFTEIINYPETHNSAE